MSVATPVQFVTSGPASPVRQSTGTSATPVTLVTGGNATPVILSADGRATPIFFADNLIVTQDVTNSFWTKVGVTTPNSTTLMQTTANSNHLIDLTTPLTRTAGTQVYNLTTTVKPVGAARWFTSGIFNGTFGAGAYTNIDLVNGSVTATATFGAVTVVSTTLQSLGNGTYNVILVMAFQAGAGTNIQLQIGMMDAANSFTFVGNTSDGIILSFMSLTQVG
jgi:hypothetical protein